MAEALATGEPLGLLDVASAFLSATDPRRDSPFRSDDAEPLPPREELVQAFLHVPRLEASALVAAIAGLTGDRVLRARAHREIALRGHVLPRWLTELDRARTADRAAEFGHVLGDGESLLLGVTLADGSELAVSVYVDHNLGTVVKDALVVPGALPDLIVLMQETTDDPDLGISELAPADVRARATEAIEDGARLFPPLETDTWPANRPLVEWAVGLLPAGGQGYQRPEWSSTDREALAVRVLGSPFATDLTDAHHRELLGDILWFGTDYGPGDPLRWSPVAVELLLVDWIPRKIVADARLLAKAPDVLRTLIRFAHAERGIRPELTAETLAAVDEFEPEHQEAIRSPRLQGPDALLATLGVLDPDELLAEQAQQELARVVGGAAALEELDAEPLPDEPFAWERVPDDVHGRVAEVVELVDRCCDAMLDVEHRTATRRLVAAAAEGDPEVFRRRGRSDTLAAAACWLVVRSNQQAGGGGLTTKELMAHFGLTGSPSQRGTALLKAIGAAAYDPAGPQLGSPRYLTSERRRQLIAARDASSDPRD
ncbi:DUF6398 domain-containing protein [Modestobacter sp. VKM Ac-2983]|uniref:DUF6398 domain-containing protein n=1 Tax=Modestobacter sp. VKM Ac-2983 TaxID=3004137 RepID=UPI0022AB9BC6|nr:DUF6398 domain-containing protein [Modestobacter sp. VKM Ac-2983]MCZ2804868.1 DUF6398 domain-containing protein [Modestobacter sp. VKM Ac-2983]